MIIEKAKYEQDGKALNVNVLKIVLQRSHVGLHQKINKANPSQSYGASPAIWIDGSRSVTRHPSDSTQKNAPCLNPRQAGGC